MSEHSKLRDGGGGSFAKDLVVRGELRGKGDLRIDGRFVGVVELDGDLAVGAEASVQAPVTVCDLEVAGELRGEVRASGAVAIRGGGRVFGDVRASRLGIDDGGALQGGIDMDFDLEHSEPSR